MPEWVKVRADFRPMPQGFALLDKANLASSLTVPTPSWTYFNNSWDGGAGTARPRYCKDAFGFVHIEGNIYNGTGSNAASPTIFNLPVGFRPVTTAGSSWALRFPAYFTKSATPTINAGYVAVWANGDVVFETPGGLSIGTNQVSYLGHIMFHPTA